MKRKFKVLYTHQKTKKKKIWQDGTLTLSVDEKRGYLCNDDKKEISTVYLEKKQVECGSDLESDRYLIQVEEEISPSSNRCSQEDQQNYLQTKPRQQSQSPGNSHGSIHASSQPLKKKFSVPRRTAPIIQTEQSTDDKADICKPLTNPHQVPLNKSIWNEIGNNDITSENSTRNGNSESIPKTFKVVTTSDNMQPNRGTQDLLNLLNGSIAKVRTDVTLTEQIEGNKPCEQQEYKSPATTEAKSVQNLVGFGDSCEDTNFTEEPAVGLLQTRLRGKIFFPTAADHDQFLDFIPTPTTVVSDSFETVDEYIEVWTSVINESINIHLWRKSQQYHKLMKNADISNLTKKRQDLKYFESSKDKCSGTEENETIMIPGLMQPKLTPEEVAAIDPPYCDHEAPCKVAVVRKPGPNTGRYFYVCKSRRNKCKFFQWVDETVAKSAKKSAPHCPPADDNIVKINNTRALTSYLNRNKVNLFVDCEIQRKCVGAESDNEKKSKKLEMELESGKRHTILRLSRQDQSLINTKDDVWVLSPSLEFNEDESLLVRVLSNNQSASGELVVQPITSSVPIHWQNGVEIHAMLLMKGNIQFAYLHNLQLLTNLPILPTMLNNSCGSRGVRFSSDHAKSLQIQAKKQKPVATFDVTLDDALKIVNDFTAKFKLTDEQSSVLCTTAEMLIDMRTSISPVLLVDGAVGSGKTFLLALAALLIFEMISTNQSRADEEGEAVIGRKRKTEVRWKILVTGKSDSVVDGVLLKLLELGFQRFSRFGDLLKIDKKLLPYSLHCRRGSDEHVKQLKLMLRQTPQSDPSRHHIEKSLKIALSGGSKRLLHNALVVGATCHDALAPSIGYYKFPVIIMDDATMISEPSTLLPLTRFACEKLLITGDSRQSSVRPSAIERSFFQRLLDAGSDLLRLTTHFRCHPHVIELLNAVAYDDTMSRSSIEVKSLMPKLPGVCFCDVIGREESCDGSWKNNDEALFCAEVVKLLLSHGVPGTSVAVMTTYDAQVSAVTSSLQEIEFYDLSDVNCVTVGTVPTLTSREFDVVIVTFVRSSGVNDDSLSHVIRMLTRARSHVIVAANLRHLTSNPVWKRVAEFCKERNRQVTSTFNFRKLFQGGSNLRHEAPLVAEHCDVPEESVVTSQGSSDADTEERFFESLKRNSEAPPSDNSDDDIPLLRHKRPKLIELNLDSIENSPQDEEKLDVKEEFHENETPQDEKTDVTNDGVTTEGFHDVPMTCNASQLFTIRDCDLTLDGENVIDENC